MNTKEKKAAKPTHTPGPWDIGEEQDGERVEPFPVNYLPISAHGQAIGRVYFGGFSNNEANARLISAAPEGYALAKIVADMAHLSGENRRNQEIVARDLAKSIIAKAEAR